MFYFNLPFFLCRFISYCVKMKGYDGSELKDAKEEEAELVAKMVALDIIDPECSYSFHLS